MNSHLNHLFNAYFDGVLTPEEASELNTILKSDSEAALAFAAAAQLHESLFEGFQSGEIPSREEPPPTEAPKKIIRFTPLLPWGIAAAACVVAAIKFSTPPATEQTVEITEELQDTGFAVLTRVVDPAWTNSTPPQQGDFLKAGSFELSQGLAQIEFLSGVSVVIEGDAAFDILSSEEMKLSKGKIRAHVPPPAIGFKIHTPTGTVLDLGTEFALDLTGEKQELHVLDGEVEWYPEDAPEILLHGGHAIALNQDAAKSFRAQPARFTSPGQLATRLITEQKEHRSDWQAHSQQLRQRQDLLAYYPMDQQGPWDRQLMCTQTNLAPGAIVAAERVAGRWHFSPNGSRVRVTIPGEYQQLTFATWARIDSLDRQYNALFLTDNYDEGEPHWQLTADGRLFFSVRLREDQFHHVHYSPPVWTHADTQQWLHLATTYDTATATAVHYLNGQEISRESAPEDKHVSTLRIGHAQIGNWGLPTKTDPSFAIRNLNGRLDEFAIFSTALAPSDIHELYLSGKP